MGIDNTLIYVTNTDQKKLVDQNYQLKSLDTTINKKNWAKQKRKLSVKALRIRFTLKF